MISPAGGLRIYVATRPTDFRKGIDGLVLVVQETMAITATNSTSCFIELLQCGLADQE